MVLAKRPGRAWRLGMLCGRAGGQERCAFDAIVDNEDLHLVSSFDSICSRVKTPRVKKAGGSDGKGTRSSKLMTGRPRRILHFGYYFNK